MTSARITHDGSNTAYFYRRGSRGVAIEANSEIVDHFRNERPLDTVINLGVGSKSDKLPFYRIGWDSGRNSFSKPTIDAVLEEFPTSWISDSNLVQLITLNEAVERYCGGKYPDILSVDTEGLDWDILNSADFSKNRPKIICAEVRTGHDTDSPDEISRLLKMRGFVPYARTWGNGIFLDGKFTSSIAC